MAKKTMRDVKDQLQELVDKMYAECPVKMKPIFPYVLVRTLPRSQKVGLIYVPIDNNKVLQEGIVLDVFKPFWKLLETSYSKESGKPAETKRVYEESSVKPGDYVLFQMYEGVPVEHTLTKTPYFKSKEYLLVSADPKGGGRNGIVAKIDRTEEVHEKLYAELMKIKQHNNGLFGEAVEKFLEKFVLNPIDLESTTFSGAGGHKTS